MGMAATLWSALIFHKNFMFLLWNVIRYIYAIRNNHRTANISVKNSLLAARILHQPARRMETHQLNAARSTFEITRAHIAASPMSRSSVAWMCKCATAKDFASAPACNAKFKLIFSMVTSLSRWKVDHFFWHQLRLNFCTLHCLALQKRPDDLACVGNLFAAEVLWVAVLYVVEARLEFGRRSFCVGEGGIKVILINWRKKQIPSWMAAHFVLTPLD